MDQRSRLQPMVFLVALVYLFTSAGWIAPVRAAEAEGVAMVVALRGQVTAVDAAGAERPLAVKSPVYVADTIRTGPSGRLQLMFTDNTIVSLGIDAEMELSSYQWDSRRGELSTRVNQGAFRVMGGNIARTSPASFTTETPAATIGIRGSMYAGRVSDGMLTVVFQGGVGIIVSNPAGTVEITVPGMGTRVRSRDEAPSAPVPFTADDLGELEEEGLEEEEVTEEASEAEAAPEEEAADEWTGATADEPAETGPAAVEVVDDTVVEQVSETVSDAGQGEQEQGVTVEKYSGRGIEVWYSEESSGTVIDSGVDSREITTIPAELTEIESDLLAQNGQTGFSDGAYEDVWIYEDYSYGEGGDHSRFALVDNRGEFWVYNRWAYDWTAETVSSEQHFLFYGLETSVNLMPESGGARYDGFFAGAGDLDSPELMDDIFGGMSVVVNWRTGRAVGYFMDYDQYYHRSIPVYLLAGVEGNTLTDARVFGLDHDYDYYDSSRDAWSVAGSGTFAQFYGTYHQGLGITAEGESRSLLDQTDIESWSVAVAAFRNPDFVYDDPTASSLWQGFITGMEVNLGVPATPPVLFRNTESADFGLAIDRQQGTFSGSYSVDGLELTVDGFYVTDHHLAGEITGPGNTRGFLGGSGDYYYYDGGENYQAGKLAEHLSWGYWAIGFDDPISAETHIFSPRGSFWVAGSVTPEEEVTGLITLGNVGHYQGGAEGVMIHGEGYTEDLYGGSTDLSIDFGANSAAVTGTITFPDVVTLGIGGASSLSATGFVAEITNILGSESATGDINGAFFGPGARSVGGNFSAAGDQAQYLGIFGGTRGDWQLPQ